MNPANTARPSSTPSTDEVMVRSVTVIAGVVVALTFIFGFGNVWTLALRLGVPPWVAPLVAPAVDLSIIGLLLGTRHLALHGAASDQLRPARRLLIFSSLVTLALNVADPLIAGQLGKAAFDSVGPLLLIGWAEIGPGLLQAIGAAGHRIVENSQPTVSKDDGRGAADQTVDAAGVEEKNAPVSANERTTTLNSDGSQGPIPPIAEGYLVERARQENTRHWAVYKRPISAETLRKRLRIGAARSRMLVSTIRADHEDQWNRVDHAIRA